MVRRVKEIGYELKFKATYDRETLVRSEIARFADKCFDGKLSALLAAVRKMK